MKIGDRETDDYAVEKPKDTYSVGGVLSVMPVCGKHLPGVRTKVSWCLATKLVDGSSDLSSATTSPQHSENDNEHNEGSMTIYVNDLTEVVKHEIMHASKQGSNYSFTQRAERMLRKAAVVVIKGSLRDLFDAWVDRMEDEMKEKEVEEAVLSTPAINARRPDAPVEDLTRRLMFGDTPKNLLERPSVAPLITPPFDLMEDDLDERDVDIVLTQLKEQTMLQNLIHKRLLQQNQRVLQLEHKNGRKLRTFIPPDSQSTKAFVDEAKQSRWINDMLHTNVQRDGMLTYLAKTEPEACSEVAKTRKLCLNAEVLDTPQTLALARLTGINDTQMCKLRSFLSHS